MRPIKEVIEKYKSILFCLGKYPRNRGRNCFGKEGFPNSLFIFYIIMNDDVFHTFLRDCGLLLKEVLCLKCNKAMTLSNRNHLVDTMVWICGEKTEGNICKNTKSIRFNSWFSNSKWGMDQILMMTYQYLKGVPSDYLITEHVISSATLVDWIKDTEKIIVEYIKSRSEKIGGKGIVVEIHESKTEKRKYKEGPPFESSWVFGGVEQGSGKCFLVVKNERTPEILAEVIEQWIEDETIISSDCWKPYENLQEGSYANFVDNHKMEFLISDNNYDSESKLCLIESMLPNESVVVWPNQFQYVVSFAWYMFQKMCENDKQDNFLKFLEVVRDINWEEKCEASSSECISTVDD